MTAPQLIYILAATAGALFLALLPLRLLLYRLLPLCLIFPTTEPITAFAGVGITPLRLIALTGAVRLLILRRGRRRTAAPSPIGAAVLATAAAWIVAQYAAYLISPDAFGAQSELLAQTFDILAPLLVVAWARPSQREVSTILQTIVGVVTLNCAIVWYEVIRGEQLLGAYYTEQISGFIAERSRFGLIRASGIFPHSILSGIAASVAFVMNLYLARAIPRPTYPVIYRACAGLCLSVAILSFSRAAWLSLLVAAVAYNYLSNRVRGSALLYAATILLLLMALTQVGPGQQLSLTGSDVIANESDASIVYRVALFSSVVDTVAEHPFGIGLGLIPAGKITGTFQGRYHDFAASIDNSLLWVTVRGGIATLIILLAALWGVATRALSMAHRLGPHSMAACLAVSISALFATLPTVALLSFAQSSLLLALLAGSVIGLQPPVVPAQGPQRGGNYGQRGIQKAVDAG